MYLFLLFYQIHGLIFYYDTNTSNLNTININIKIIIIQIFLYFYQEQMPIVKIIHNCFIL